MASRRLPYSTQAEGDYGGEDYAQPSSGNSYDAGGYQTDASVPPPIGGETRDSPAGPQVTGGSVEDYLNATNTSQPSSNPYQGFDASIYDAVKSGYAGRGEDYWNSQVDYFRPKQGTEGKDDAYWIQRASGMGAGGADVADSGRYAGQDFGTLAQQQGGGNDILQQLLAQSSGAANQAVNDSSAAIDPGWLARYYSDPAAVAAQQAAASGGSVRGETDGGVRSGPAGSAAPKTNKSQVWDQILSMMNSGPNQGVINARTESARENLERQRRAEGDTNQAALASRGLIGSGPEAEALTHQSERLGEQFATTTRDIWADESQNADQRIMQALGLGANLASSEDQQLIDWFNAQTNRTVGEGNVGNDAQRNAITSQLGNRNADVTSQLGNKNADITQLLGLGNLALGNQNSVNSFNLGQGQLGLGYDQLNSSNSNTNTSNLLELLRIMGIGTGISAGGYEGGRTT